MLNLYQRARIGHRTYYFGGGPFLFPRQLRLMNAAKYFRKKHQSLVDQSKAADTADGSLTLTYLVCMYLQIINLLRVLIR